MNAHVDPSPARARDHLRAAAVAACLLGMLTLAAAGNVAPWEDAVPQWRQARVTLKSQSLPLRRLTGAGQGWRMFADVPRHTGRLEVDVDEGEGWRTVFFERSPQARWRADTFEHHRWREFINRVRNRRGSREWTHLNRVVSGWAFDDFPRAQRVRLQITRATVVGPKTLRRRGELRFSKVSKALVTERPAP